MVICIVICARDKTRILTSATYMYTKVVRICRKIIKKDESMKVWHLDHGHQRIRDWFELFYFYYYQILTAINKFKIMLDVVHADWKRLNIDSPSVARGLRYFSTQKYRNPHGQLKENLFLPLFNTNFISKSFKITDLTTCGERHETEFSTTGSAGLKHRNNGRKLFTRIMFTKATIATVVAVIILSHA